MGAEQAGEGPGAYSLLTEALMLLVSGLSRNTRLTLWTTKRICPSKAKRCSIVLQMAPPSTMTFSTRRPAGRHLLDIETDCKIVQVPFVEGKQKLVQFCPFVFWKVAIDGDDKTQEDKEGINNLLSAFGQVTIQGMAVKDDDEEFFDE
jgi:hypothetical protein